MAFLSIITGTFGYNVIQGDRVTNLFAWAGPATDGTGLSDAAIFQGNQAADGATLGVVEIVTQNLAPTGTSDVVALMDTGTDELGFLDSGINGSVYDGNAMGWGHTLPGDGYSYVAPPVTGDGGNLAIGVIGAANTIQLFAGGSEGTNVKMAISNDGVQFGFYDANTTGGPSTFTTPILDMSASTPATCKKTIDPSARKLYYADGTTVAVDYSVQDKLVIAGGVTLSEMAAPATPAANKVAIYVDSADGSLKAKFDSGNVVTIAAYA